MKRKITKEKQIVIVMWAVQSAWRIWLLRLVRWHESGWKTNGSGVLCALCCLFIVSHAFLYFLHGCQQKSRKANKLYDIEWLLLSCYLFFSFRILLTIFFFFVETFNHTKLWKMKKYIELNQKNILFSKSSGRTSQRCQKR